MARDGAEPARAVEDRGKLEGAIVGGERQTRAVRRAERDDGGVVGEALDEAALAGELRDYLLKNGGVHSSTIGSRAR